jgi:hypothetical protein
MDRIRRGNELEGGFEGGDVEAVQDVADVLVNGLVADAEGCGGLFAGERGVLECVEHGLLARGEGELGAAAWDCVSHGMRD